jgi:hypothetical protein
MFPFLISIQLKPIVQHGYSTFLEVDQNIPWIVCRKLSSLEPVAIYK